MADVLCVCVCVCTNHLTEQNVTAAQLFSATEILKFINATDSTCQRN